MSRLFKTVFATAVLVVSASVQTHMAQDQAPAAAGTGASRQGRVVGIGGVFFKVADRAKAREWYGKHLGLVEQGQGVMLPWRERDDPQKEHFTVWSTFPANTDYFAPGQAAMINYIVDGLDAMLARLQAEGVRVDPKRMNEPYGRFAWIYDSDGNKIELWEPQTAERKP